MEFENVLPSEIEKRSFEIIESELPYDIEKTIKPIVKRVIHTTADFDYLDNLCFSENVVEIIKNAIKNGADIVTDTQMARSDKQKTSCVIWRRGTLFYVRRGRCKSRKGKRHYKSRCEYGKSVKT